MTLTVSKDLLREALAHLRGCGVGRSECVCWMTGPLATPGVIDEVLHPEHNASAVEYEIEQGWLNDTFIALARGGLELRAQIHSHPTAAYHSATDDAFPAVAIPGFLSIVVPNFARRNDLKGAHIVELWGDGSWRTVDPEQALVIA